MVTMNNEGCILLLVRVTTMEENIHTNPSEGATFNCRCCVMVIIFFSTCMLLLLSAVPSMGDKHMPEQDNSGCGRKNKEYHEKPNKDSK